MYASPKVCCGSDRKQTTKGEIVSLEQVQNQAVRLIAGIKGTRGVSEAGEKLYLLSLQQRRKQQRFSLLMRGYPPIPRRII